MSDEGVTATVDQNGDGSIGEAGRNGHGRGSFDGERRGRSAYLVGVLARALTTQVEEIARSAAPTPDGWWFAEPDPTSTSDDQEEQR